MALDKSGVVHVKGARGSESYTCCDCGGKMSLCREHTRKRVVCGIELTTRVRAHFKHTGERPDTCSPESAAHKAAKRILALTRPPVLFTCTACSAHLPIDYDGHGEDAAVEESPFESFWLDVGFVRAGHTVGAIEVYKTHRISDDKATALTRANLAWAEVSADEVISYDELRTAEAPGRPEAINALRCGVDLCGTCLDTHAAQLREAELTRIAAESRVKAEERMCVLRSSIATEAAFDALEERITEEVSRANAMVERALAQHAITAIRRLRKKTLSKADEVVITKVLRASSRAIRWGRHFYWDDPEEIARKNPYYFVRVLCGVGHGARKSTQETRARECKEVGVPPPHVVAEARAVRRKLRMCIDCFTMGGAENEGCLTCIPCFRRRYRWAVSDT